MACSGRDHHFSGTESFTKHANNPYLFFKGYPFVLAIGHSNGIGFSFQASPR
jgi:hypothetical protein